MISSIQKFFVFLNQNKKYKIPIKALFLNWEISFYVDDYDEYDWVEIICSNAPERIKEVSWNRLLSMTLISDRYLINVFWSIIDQLESNIKFGFGGHYDGNSILTARKWKKIVFEKLLNQPLAISELEYIVDHYKNSIGEKAKQMMNAKIDNEK